MAEETEKGPKQVFLLGEIGIKRAFGEIDNEFPPDLREHPTLGSQEDFSPNQFMAVYLVRLEGQKSMGVVVAKHKDDPDFMVGVCEINLDFQRRLDNQEKSDRASEAKGNLILDGAIEKGVLARSSLEYQAVGRYLKEKGMSPKKLALMMQKKDQSELIDRFVNDTSDHFRDPIHY